MELKDFCAENRTRYNLTKPFKIGSKIIASTGHIIAWKEDDGSVNEFSENAPQIELSWLTDFNPSDDLPNVELKIEKCEHCENGIVKKENLKCTTCNGTSYEECGECGADKECGDCEGTGISEEEGEHQCDDCDGHGNVDMSNPVEVFGHKFSAKRILQLKESGAKVQLLDGRITSHPVVLGFKVNDLTGFILPMAVT